MELRQVANFINQKTQETDNWNNSEWVNGISSFLLDHIKILWDNVVEEQL